MCAVAPPVSAGSGYRRVAEDTHWCPAGGPGNLDGAPAHITCQGSINNGTHQFLRLWVVPQLWRVLMFPNLLYASLSLACATVQLALCWLGGGTVPGISVHLMCSWGQVSSVATCATILDSLKCALLVLGEASGPFSPTFEIKIVKKCAYSNLFFKLSTLLVWHCTS